MPSSSEPHLGFLRRQAEALAAHRHETPVGAHLLVAIAATPCAASDLLVERGASARQLLKALDALTERGQKEPLAVLLERGKQLAQRMGVGAEPSATHLLVALLNDTRGTARLCLEASGVDARKLRALALTLGQGIVRRSRTLPETQKARELVLPSPEAPKGMAVPLVPHAVRRAALEPPRLPGVAVPLVPQVGPAPLARRRTSEISVAPAPQARVLPTVEETPADSGAARFGLDARQYPLLTSLGKNLCLAAARGELDPVIGREAEIEQVLDVLAKRQGNSPCLVGVAGAGKTSVARGVALHLAEGHARNGERILIEIPIPDLYAGTGVRGALAIRWAALKKEVQKSEGRVVLFFDEIHQLLASDAAEEIGSDLRLSLAKGELPCIGAMTFDEYRRYIESDSALSRRFSVVEVDQPSREDAYLILDSLARKLEGHHGVSYEAEALALSVSWSMRYLPGRALPDQAVSIVDLAGARVRRRGKERVTPEAVAEVVAGLVGMPIERLLESDGDRMLRLEEILGERVIGHPEHLHRIARILRRNAAGLGARRPIGTFLLLGPTGVGKTETAKAIAEALFHTESAMTRIDMSELSEAHAVAKLVGAPPGYIGHDAGGQLTEAVRQRPYQVVLLDEIEKAHPEVLTAFLAVFDEGRMTDGRGRTVDFTNSVIVLTSNLGADAALGTGRRRVGFSTSDASADALTDGVVAAARHSLPPELYNRIDEVLVFAPLGRDDVRRIARKMIEGVARALRERRGIGLEIEDEALEYLLDSGGFDPELGARPMRRILARSVEAPLAEKILRGELCAGDLVLLGLEVGELHFDVVDGAALEAAHSAAE